MVKLSNGLYYPIVIIAMLQDGRGLWAGCLNWEITIGWINVYGVNNRFKCVFFAYSLNDVNALLDTIDFTSGLYTPLKEILDYHDR